MSITIGFSSSGLGPRSLDFANFFLGNSDEQSGFEALVWYQVYGDIISAQTSEPRSALLLLPLPHCALLMGRSRTCVCFPSSDPGTAGQPWINLSFGTRTKTQRVLCSKYAGDTREKLSVRATPTVEGLRASNSSLIHASSSN